MKSSKVTKDLTQNVEELDSLLDDLQKDQERQLYKSKNHGRSLSGTELLMSCGQKVLDFIPDFAPNLYQILVFTPYLGKHVKPLALADICRS